MVTSSARCSTRAERGREISRRKGKVSCALPFFFGWWHMLINAINETVKWLAEGVHQLWQTGLIQTAFRELLMLLHHAVAWLLRHPGGLVGGLLAFWLAGLFASVSTTAALMNFAFGDFGMFVFYVVVVGAGVAIGSGAVEIKRKPFDDR